MRDLPREFGFGRYEDLCIVATHFGVSRSTVREAFKLLEEVGAGALHP